MEQLQALGITLACEVPAMLVLARRCSARWVVLVTLTANGLTHPLAWHLAAKLSPMQYRSGLWWIEGGVVAAEALWYGLWLRAKPLTVLQWSLLANAASLGLGWWLW